MPLFIYNEMNDQENADRGSSDECRRLVSCRRYTIMQIISARKTSGMKTARITLSFFGRYILVSKEPELSKERGSSFFFDPA